MSAYQPFLLAKPAFPACAENEYNVSLGLYASADGDGPFVLRIATSCFYRVFVNGEFFFYGPARAAHGFFRVDELPIPGKEHTDVAVELISHNINGYGVIRQPGFVQAELCRGEKVLAATGGNGYGFETFELTERVRRSQRHSFQRGFVENYRLLPEYDAWHAGKPSPTARPVSFAETSEKTLIGRNIPLNTFPCVLPAKKEAHGAAVLHSDAQRPVWADRCLVGAGSEIFLGYRREELECCVSDDYCRMSFENAVTDGVPFDGKVTLDEGSFEVLSLPVEKSGFLAFDFTCRESGSLYVGHEEIPLENGDMDALRTDCCNLFRIDAGKGSYRFCCMEPMGFKYVKFIAPRGSFTLGNIRMIEYICPEPITASYSGTDQTLAMIYEAACESFKQSSADIFMDCPTRERAGWLCDSFFIGRSEKELTGQNLVEHNFLENFLLPDSYPGVEQGMLPMCYPADHYDHIFIPNWSLWFILELKEHLDRTGDAEFVGRFRDKVYALLDWFKRLENNDGLLEKLPSWVFVEWSKANSFCQDINFPSNMVYAKALKDASVLFGDKALGDKAEALFATIRSRSFDGTFFTDNEIIRDGKTVNPGNRTETCQYYAFFTGTATPESYPELWKTLTAEFGPARKTTGAYPEIHPSNAFIGNYLRLILLEENGLYDQLLSEIRDYLAYMAVRTGTLWENDSSCASCNHGFASYAAHFIRVIEDHV